MENLTIIKVFVSRLVGRRLLLDESERAMAEEITDRVRRTRYEQTRSFVRQTLAHYLNVDPLSIVFTRTAAGKPLIASIPGGEFSISHSSDWIALAAAPFPVGIDIETRTPRVDPLALAKRFFHPKDAAVLAAAPERGVEFLAQWVAKEAVSKATGTGIAGFLDSLTCEFANGAITGIHSPRGHYSLFNFRLADGSPGAVAWESSISARVIITEESPRLPTLS